VRGRLQEWCVGSVAVVQWCAACTLRALEQRRVEQSSWWSCHLNSVIVGM
jgi:hypothetical protein